MVLLCPRGRFGTQSFRLVSGYCRLWHKITQDYFWDFDSSMFLGPNKWKKEKDLIIIRLETISVHDLNWFYTKLFNNFRLRGINYF